MQFNLSTEIGTVCTSQLIFLKVYATFGQLGKYRLLETSRLSSPTGFYTYPNIAGLADLYTTLTVTATPERNGTVVQCRGDEPSERMSLTLHIASEF